jgi:hypothetical protein
VPSPYGEAMGRICGLRDRHVGLEVRAERKNGRFIAPAV